MDLNKLKRKILNIFYSLPHGLKAADTEIMGSNSEGIPSTEISQEVSDERVAKHLLKGEVTQEVEELRYRTYKVANESENYEYIGNGIALKQEEKKKEEIGRYKFTQDNENICETVLETLNQVGKYGVERYRFEIEYNYFIRFKLEKFATKVDVNINEKLGIIETVLHFNAINNPYDAVSMPLINELDKLLSLSSKYEIEKNEIASCFKSFSFVTYKASNEDDFTTYSFSNGGKFEKIEKNDYEFLVTLFWDEYTRIPLNLEVKYYSKTMAEKYENKEKKNVPIPLSNLERKSFCSVCGREIPLNDADILRYNGDEIICKECLKGKL